MTTAIIEKNPFQIIENSRFNSFEVSFEGKPSEAVRNALKALKMRWNPKRLVWYGFATEYEITNAILNANGEAQEAPGEGTCVVTDGYLGGGAIYGSKSNQHLYGKNLSAAIRKDLKAAGLKATVRVETYSGGQHIYVTMQVNASDYISKEEFVSNYQINFSCNWIADPEGGEIHSSQFWNLDSEKRDAIRTYNALREYDKAWSTGKDHNFVGPNHYYMDNLDKTLGMFTKAAHDRMRKANAIVLAYRYDESNGMVDYYNTNFYYDIDLKNVDYKG